MKLSVSRFATFLLLFIAFAAPAQTTGQIRGTVTGENKKALESVKVELSSPSLGARTVSTDKNGQFRFPALAPGRYTVTFTLESHADVQKNAIVRLDGTVTVDARLFRISG